MNFRKDINGLRAIAVLAVVLFHFNIAGFSGGFSGVDIFFVISGYLMTGIIFSKLAKSQFSLIDFYLHRARRIIPALAFLCIALTIFGFFFFLTHDLREITKNIRKVILFVSNFTFYKEAGYFDTPSQENWLLHTWSLSVEWQFYLIYPLFIVLLRKFINLKLTKLLLIVAAISSLALSIFYTPIDPSSAFYLLPTRMWEMLAGGIVFLFPISLKPIKKYIAQYLGLIFIIISVLLFNEQALWPGYLATIPVLGTMLIIWANQANIITDNIISQWLGKISYSVYLWHWPIVVLLLISGLLSSPLYKVIGILVSLILGTLSYFFIEKHFKLTHSRKIEAIKYVVIILITIAIASSIGSIAKRHPQLRNQSLQQLNNIVEDKFKILSERCLLPTFDNTSPDCIIGKGDINIIVLGDSHAATLFPVITKLNTQGASIFWTLSSCPIIKGIQQKHESGCNDFVSSRLELLKTSYPNVPVLIADRSTYYYHNKDSNYYFDNKESFKNNFRTNYINTMCQISKNHPVYVLKPIPSYPYDVPKRMVTDRIFRFNEKPLTVFIPEYQANNKFLLEIMEETSEKCGVHLLDPTDYLCKNGTCYATKEKSPLYSDDNHLSDEGSMQLAPLFQNIFR